MRLALRQLAKSPGFTAVVILTLALGIGATTAIFSAVNAIMLRPLPVKDPSRLVTLSLPFLWAGHSEPVTWRLHDQFRARAASFSDMCVSGPVSTRPFAASGTNGTETDFVKVAAVSGNFFSVLGVPAGLGRDFTSDDDRRDRPQPVAVISHAFWRRRFAADPAIVGQAVRIEEAMLTVVGISAAGFSGVTIGENIDVWIPLCLHPRLDPELEPPGEDEGMGSVMGRLRPGVSLATARAELDVIFQQDLARRAELRNLKNPKTRRYFVGRTLELHPGATGFRDGGSLQWKFARPMSVLLAAAAVVLLAACANVAGLLLVRGTARQRELAVRAALGAGRARLAGQLLAESILLSAAGGLLGVVFARGGTAFLARFIPEAQASVDLAPDSRVLAFALILVAGVGFTCGLIPAFRLSRIDLATALKSQGGKLAGGSGGGLNQALVVTQIALSCMLLTAAGLFGRSLQNLKRADAGFSRDKLMTFTFEPGKAYAGQRGVALYHRLLERLRALPGVSGATLSSWMPLVSGGAGTRFIVEGYAPGPDEVVSGHFLEIGPRFFTTLGLTLLRGRDFDETDLAPNARPVAIIGETMARHFYGASDPLGRTFKWGRQVVEIVGVAHDIKSYERVREKPGFTFYRPYVALIPDLQHVRYQIRALGDPRALAADIRAAARAIEPRARVLELRTMDDAVGAFLVTERAVAQLSGFFSVFTLGVASLGLYGLLSFGVVRRTREIGVRMALGANVRDVAALILKQGLALALLGCALGTCGAFVAARLIGSMLYGVPANDALTVTAAALTLMVIAILACWFPARRATKIEPVVALRAE